MQEAFELVCRKRNLKDHALLRADRSKIISLNRTVTSLQGKRELLLGKWSMLDLIFAKKISEWLQILMVNFITCPQITWLLNGVLQLPYSSHFTTTISHTRMVCIVVYSRWDSLFRYKHPSKPREKSSRNSISRKAHLSYCSLFSPIPLRFFQSLNYLHHLLVPIGAKA